MKQLSQLILLRRKFQIFEFTPIVENKILIKCFVGAVHSKNFLFGCRQIILIVVHKIRTFPLDCTQHCDETCFFAMLNYSKQKQDYIVCCFSAQKTLPSISKKTLNKYLIICSTCLLSLVSLCFFSNLKYNKDLDINCDCC